MLRPGSCSVCGTELDETGFCWKCSGEGPPTPRQEKLQSPPEPICTQEQNRAGLEMLREAIFGDEEPTGKAPF